MNILPEIDKISNELTNIFKDLHQHPELGFEEIRTSKIVKEKQEDVDNNRYSQPRGKRVNLQRSIPITHHSLTAHDTASVAFVCFM